MKRIITNYHVTHPRVTEALTLAVVSDLHNGPAEDMLPRILAADAILLPGDLVNRHHHGMEHLLPFLLAIRNKDVFFSVGNHEAKSPEGKPVMELMRSFGFHVLDNRIEHYRGLSIGGLSASRVFPAGNDMADRLAKEEGFRLLLCHHPEYYDRLVKGKEIDLCLAGHAHGGQVQVFGQGLFAPGQGIFPKLTHGYYDDGRLLVSRGFTNSAKCPRWGNPCELIMLKLEPGECRRYE